AQMNDLEDIQRILQQLRLLHVARNAVENKNFAGRMELVDHFHSLDVLLPELHGKFVGHELATRRIFPGDPAHFRAQIQAAENVAAGRVKESGNGPQNLALSALAAARSAEKEHGFIPHSNGLLDSILHRELQLGCAVCGMSIYGTCS